MDDVSEIIENIVYGKYIEWGGEINFLNHTLHQ